SFAACRPTATVRRPKGISTMRIRSTLSTLLAAVLLAGVANAAHAQAREQGRLLIASEVLEEIRDSRDQSIPERLLQRAYAAAGPVGRQAEVATDATFRSEVYSYSRSRGVFAGIALDGSALTIDDKADAALYKRPGIMASDILAGNVTTSDESARRFLAAVTS